MLFDLGDGLRKRMIGPEVGQHALQAERIAATDDLSRRREGAQEFLAAAVSIGLFVNPDQAEAGLPMKLFFACGPSPSGHHSRFQGAAACARPRLE